MGLVLEPMKRDPVVVEKDERFVKPGSFAKVRGK